jgi:uncharacterized membrane protein YsdA (DUF1294 family)
MSGFLLASSYMSVAIIAEWILLVVIAFGGLVPLGGSMGALRTGLVVNHRPSQCRFMSILDMVVLWMLRKLIFSLLSMLPLWQNS